MSFDEFLFGKFYKYLEKVRKSPEEEAKAVELKDINSRLTILARALNGAQIYLFNAEKEGGVKHESFFLPVRVNLFDTAEQNLRFYLYRILYLTAQREAGMNWYGREERSLKESRRKARESAPEVLKKAAELFPVTVEMHDEFKALLEEKAEKDQPPALYWLYGKWMREKMDVEQEAEDGSGDEGGKGSDRKKEEMTNRKAKAVEDMISLTPDTKQQEDYVLNHYFEKVETAEEFSGSWRSFDGDDELDSHKEALDEISMKYTVRVDDEVHSVYNADFIENANVAEVKDTKPEKNEIAFKYDEWNFSKRKYKPDFCTLYERGEHRKVPGYVHELLTNHRGTLMRLRKRIADVNNKMLRKKRLIDGDDFDLDAATDFFIDLETGHTPSEHVYTANRKREKDLSVILLLDISLSSDGFVDNRRVIDVERECAALFAEVLEENNADFSINGFYSKTRNQSKYVRIKRFGEQWNKVKDKLGAVEPSGYTRIGTALRHSGALLRDRPGENKWVVLFSDGKPNDYDKYEGKYGVRDVSRALTELNNQGVNTYGFAIEADAKYYLPQMFGPTRYNILSEPRELPEAMAELFLKMKHER